MNPQTPPDVNCEQALAEVERRIAQRPLDVGALLQWVHSPCLEVRSAAFALLFDRPADVSALMETSIVHSFFLAHLEECITENRTGRYTPSRHLAGHALRAWFQRLWRQQPRPDATLQQIRDLLARLVQQGDADVRESVVLSVLEHLFADPSVLAYFDDWADEPRLASVFAEARELAGDNDH